MAESEIWTFKYEQQAELERLRVCAANCRRWIAFESGPTGWNKPPNAFSKINFVEQKLGVRLFERLRTGFKPTPAGEEIVDVARQMSILTNEAERHLSGRDLRPSGVVRIATTDTLLFALLTPMLIEFRQIEPDIVLEIIASNDILDLSLRDADIALRPVEKPEPHLVGRKLGIIQQGIYGRAHQDNQTADQPRANDQHWIGPSRAMAYHALHKWMEGNHYNDLCVCRMNTVLGMYRAVQAGVGRAVLPTYLGEADLSLSRYGGPVKEVAVDLWLLTHPDLRQTARVRAVLNFFADSDFIPSRLRL